MSVNQQEKFILDATAGFRMMWFNKQHPNTIYIDQRPECEPDQVADWTKKLPYEDNKFKLIVFDPPHILFDKGKVASNLSLNFGALSPETWQQDLKKGLLEMWRILAPFGVMIVKWNNYCISSDKFLKLCPAEPLIYQVSASREKHSRKNKGDGNHVKTLWFCFMKIPDSSFHAQPTAKEKQT